MWDFLQTPPAQLIIWTAVLAMITVLAIYFVQSLRDRSGNDHVSANDLMTNYREMHSRGDITDAEFRTIKTALKDKLERELSDSGNDD